MKLCVGRLFPFSLEASLMHPASTPRRAGTTIHVTAPVGAALQQFHGDMPVWIYLDCPAWSLLSLLD